jgi:hypothetical protein
MADNRAALAEVVAKGENLEMEQILDQGLREILVLEQKVRDKLIVAMSWDDIRKTPELRQVAERVQVMTRNNNRLLREAQVLVPFLSSEECLPWISSEKRKNLEQDTDSVKRQA